MVPATADCIATAGSITSMLLLIPLSLWFDLRAIQYIILQAKVDCQLYWIGLDCIAFVHA